MRPVGCASESIVLSHSLPSSIKHTSITLRIFHVSLTGSAKPVADAGPAYEIGYKIDSSRGQNPYLVKATIIDSKVYVFTVQCKEETSLTLFDLLIFSVRAAVLRGHDSSQLSTQGAADRTETG